MGSEPQRRLGLLIDYGGVLTSGLLDSLRAFSQARGIDLEGLGRHFREDPEARERLIALETGRLEIEAFEPGLAAMLGVEPDGLIDQLFAGSVPDEAMRSAVARARLAGVRTGLVSNSWGTARYDRSLLAELFDAIIISGEVGIRKPAPEIYTLGAARIGLAPAECVFVDDLVVNLAPARELGMATVHHVTAGETIRSLEALLGVALR